MRKPHKVDVSVDSEIDLEKLSETVAVQVMATYAFIKITKTLCSIVEHVVVTKVK